MTTVEGRLTRLEEAYRHLATKEDLDNVKADLGKFILEVENRMIKWIVGTMLVGMGVAASIAIALQRLLAG